ncbi:hypothetical protein GCM10028820_13050 [Tessaracoccus terricola]
MNAKTISHLRCADEDRELVARVLNNAYADGRLTFEEHDERISNAYNAKTFGELDDLTLDLIPGGAQTAPAAAPTPMGLAAYDQPASPVPTPPVGAPASADTFTGGRAILSNYHPDKGLVMPAYSELVSVLGDVRVDLVDAVFTQREITIKATAVLGEIRIRIPAGVKVVSNMTNVLGDYKCEGTIPADNGVVIRIEGSTILGDVKVLGPGIKKARKYDKFV